jgi:hypothetical protein
MLYPRTRNGRPETIFFIMCLYIYIPTCILSPLIGTYWECAIVYMLISTNHVLSVRFRHSEFSA